MLSRKIKPIGVFDSGVGGLSVLRSIREVLPSEKIIYIADQIHVPYGTRSITEIQQFSHAITKFFLRQEAKIIVVACNTASAAALHYLRSVFTDIPFVGMEPAVKPAVEQTKTGVVGVLATPATFQGALYNSVLERFGKGVKILQHTCPGLVENIEKGRLNTTDTRHLLEKVLEPMLKQNIDVIVLGCTHYPFVIPLIKDIVGSLVRVIDPSPAVALQVKRVLENSDLLNTENSTVTPLYFTTGDPQKFKILLPKLVGMQAEISKLCWSTNNKFSLDNC